MKKKKHLKILSIILTISIIAVSLVGCSNGNSIGLVIDNRSETVTQKDQTISGAFSTDADIASVRYSVQHNNDNGISDSGEAIIKDNTYSFKIRLLLGENEITITAATKDEKKQSKKVTITYDSGKTYEEIEEDNISIDEKTEMKYVNNIIRIYFSNDVSNEKINEIVSSINGEIVGAAYSIGERDIKIPETDFNTLKEICNNLKKINEVVYATYDIIMPDPVPTVITNDPYKNANGGDWYLDAIEAPAAWDYNNRFNEINIGICDDGFDTRHEDLKDVIHFPTQWLNELNSKEYHGTHVAGIIGAIANNKKGIAGIDWKSKLYCIDWKPTEKQKKNNIAWNTEARILSSLRYAVESGCKVVNYSLGYTNGMPNGTTQFDNEFINRTGGISAFYMYQLLSNGYDFVVVQSAGNGTSGKNNPNDENEQKDLEHVLAVDAVNNGFFCSVTEDNIILPENSTITKQDILDRIIIVGNAQKNDDGNYQQHVTSNGGKQVDICAPGTKIFSTVPWAYGSYMNLDGTSMSAPMVTAVCGMVWSVNGKFTGAEVKDIVCNSYDENIWVWDNPDGKHTTNDKYRMLNAKLSVEEAIKRTDTENIKEDNKQADNIDYEKIYYQYIKDNLDIIDYDKFPDDENNTGVFSALIEDFDNDNIKEMVTFSYEKENGGSVVLNLYKYVDSKVKLCDTSKETIYASGGGNFSNNMCGIIENKIIKIQYDNYGFGGSSHGMAFMSYKIENNRLVLINNYSLSEFYRYDQYEYKETVSGKSFSNENNFINAVKSANYDVKAHLHVGYTDSKFNPETDDYKNNDLFKGNHIFTLVNSDSMIKAGEYGFINDNTTLKNFFEKYNTESKNGTSQEQTSKNNITIDELKKKYNNAVDFYSRYIYGPCEYQDFNYQINNGELTLTKYDNIDTYEKFLEKAKEYFTDDIAVAVLKSINAQNYNGKLYTSTNGGVGSTLEYEDVKIEKIGDSKYRVLSTYHWAGGSTTKKECNFVNENGDWVLDNANFEF